MIVFNIIFQYVYGIKATKLDIQAGQVQDKFQMTLIFVDILPKMSMKTSPFDLHRIYWSPGKWQNLLNFLQGVMGLPVYTYHTCCCDFWVTES